PVPGATPQCLAPCQRTPEYPGVSGLGGQGEGQDWGGVVTTEDKRVESAPPALGGDAVRSGQGLANTKSVPKARGPKATVTSLEELIKAHYLGKRKPAAPTAKEFAAISENAMLSEELLADVQPGLLSPRGLETTLDLILLGARLRGHLPLRRTLFGFIENLLCSHPIFAASEKAVATIKNLPEAPPARIVFEQLLELPAEVQSLKVASKK